jgi:hypothetical protein
MICRCALVIWMKKFNGVITNLELLRQGHQLRSLCFWGQEFKSAIDSISSDASDDYQRAKEKEKEKEIINNHKKWILAIAEGQRNLGLQSELYNLRLNFDHLTNTEWGKNINFEGGLPVLGCLSGVDHLLNAALSMINIRELTVDHSHMNTLQVLSRDFIGTHVQTDRLLFLSFHFFHIIIRVFSKSSSLGSTQMAVIVSAYVVQVSISKIFVSNGIFG